MFIRENKNRSGSVSIQIISKSRGIYKVVKTVGCATQRHEIEHLKNLARQEIELLQSKPKLFKSEQDELIEDVISSLSNSSISTVGPELIFGCIYDYIVFRMLKADLRIRPIYHRLRHRIEAHICIAFTAYTVYKELERVLHEEKSSISLKTASEITHNIYQITYQLPDSKHIKLTLPKMDEQQSELYQIVQKYF